MKRRHLITGAAVLASGLMLAGCVGLQPLWWLAWIAPVPLLWAAARSGTRAAFAIGTLAALLGQLVNAGYLLELSGPVMLPLLLLAPALGWGLLAALWQRWCARAPAWSWPWAWALLGPAWGVLVLQASPHGLWGSLAATQVEALPVIQIASVLGPLGIVALLGLGAGSLATLALRWPQRPWAALAAPLATLALVLGWGQWRSTQSIEGRPLTVGLAAVDTLLLPDMPPERAHAVWQAYDGATRALAAQGARLVVLPEKIEPLPRSREPARRTALALAAQAAGSAQVVGVTVTDGEGRRLNRAWLLPADDAPLVSYDKQHLVPGWESAFATGHALQRFSLGGHTLGLAICKDMDFPALARDYSRAGVAALAVPAWDFGRDGWLHARMAVLAGVEGGFAVIRSARQGLLTVSDRHGRVIAETRSAGGGGGARLLATLPLATPEATVYARIGDAFGWLCLVLVLAAAAARRSEDVVIAPPAGCGVHTARRH